MKTLKFGSVVRCAAVLAAAAAVSSGFAADDESKSAEVTQSVDTNAVDQARPVYDLNKIMVVANRVGLPATDVPADTTAVSRREIGRFGRKEAFDSLRAVPGVQVTHRYDTGGMSGGITLRGMNYNNTSGGNVLMLLDGVPQRRLSLGGPYFGCLPHRAITEMELVKGNLAAQYGRGGMLGVLSMTTTPEDPNVLWGEVEGAYDTRTTGFRETFRGNAPIDELHGGYAYVTVDNTSAQGWQHGKKSSWSTDVYFNMGLNVTERDFFQLFGGAMHGDWHYATPVVVDPATGHRMPGVSRRDSYDIFDNFGNEIGEYRVSGRWKHEFDDDWDLQLTTSYWCGDTDSGVNRPTSVTSYSASNPVVSGINNIDSRQYEHGFFNEALVTKRYELTDWLSGSATAGGTYEYWQSDKKQWTHGSGMTYNLATHAIGNYAHVSHPTPAHTDMNFNYFGVFFMNNWKVTRFLDVQYGLREDWQLAEQRDIAKGLADSTSSSFFTPSVGAVVHLWNDGSNLFDVYANWGRNYNPNTRTGFVQESMCDLTPEFNETFEYGVRGSFLDDLVIVKAAAFQIRRRDVAELVNGVYVHSQDQSVDGFELGVQVNPIDDVHVFANYSYQDSEVTKCENNPQRVGTRLAFVPRNLATIGIEYAPEEGLGAAFMVNYVGTEYGGYYNNVKCPSYWLADASVYYRWKGWQLSLYCNNVFDEEYYSDYFMDNNNWFFEGTPVSFGVSLKYRF